MKYNYSSNPKLSFTLIELVVACGLILILVSVLGFDFSNRREDLRIKSGQQLAGSLLLSARNQAVLKQANARLIIHNNPGEPEKYLRQMGIIYEEKIHSGRWKSLNGGSLLPPGVYFNTEISSWTDAQIMMVEFPRARFQIEGSGEKWIYYEFTSSGVFNEPGAQFVVGAGVLHPLNNKDFEIEFNNHAMGGILIGKFSGIPFYTSPENIR